MSEDRLSARLRVSAAEFTESGLRARLEQDRPVEQLRFATALELLTKAKLASLHGSLIAAKDFDSLLHLAGHGTHSRVAADQARTISITEALQRVGRLVPEIELLREDLRLLADARNGVVHGGHVGSELQDWVFVSFIRACDLLLAALPSPREEFWGEFVDLVDLNVAQSAKADELFAAEAVKLGQLRFEERFSELDAPATRAVQASIEATYAPTKYEQDLYDCPACGTQALVDGSSDPTWVPEWEDGDDGEPWSPGAYVVVTFRPGTLSCRACGLVLDGDYQLAAAGVPDSWEIEDADPADFMESDDEWD